MTVQFARQALNTSQQDQTVVGLLWLKEAVISNYLTQLSYELFLTFYIEFIQKLKKVLNI